VGYERWGEREGLVGEGRGRGGGGKEAVGEMGGEGKGGRKRGRLLDERKGVRGGRGMRDMM